MSEHKDLGKILKEAREEEGLSLKDVSKETKISISILESFENGEFRKLPSYIHAQGFLKLYAKFLGLSYEELKDIFDREYKGVLYEGDKAKEALNEAIESVSKTSRKRRYLSISLVVMLILVSLIYVTLYLKIQHVPSKNVNKRTYTENATLDMNNENITISENNTENTDNYSVLTTLDLAKQLKESERTDNVELKSVTLEFSDTCWVHINIDGKHEMDFIAEAGISKIIEFLDFFEIDIGNASAIKIKYKDQTFTGLGGWRQPIKKLTFRLDNNGKLIFTKK